MSAVLFLEKMNKESLKSSTVKTSILKVTLHFNLIFSIKESTSSEEESKTRIRILEYHTRAMATLQE
jgi:hypothetical protein